MGRGYAEARDGNEPDIIEALASAGAIVQKLTGGNGRPDLLVGYRGHNILMEVKNPATRGHGGGTNKRLLAADVATGGEYYHLAGEYGAKVRELKRSQAKWFTKWQGARPYIVMTADEAVEILDGYRDAGT